jgi:hypothetical protein
MSDPSLFGAEGGGGGGSGGSTVTFNAGKCMFDSSTNTVTPIKEKGQVSFVQVREHIRVRAIGWKNDSACSCESTPHHLAGEVFGCLSLSVCCAHALDKN